LSLSRGMKGLSGTNELAIRSGWAVIAITRAHFAQGAFSRKTGIRVC
jgi:hypothetical protein